MTHSHFATSPPRPDFSRHDGLLDRQLLARAHIAFIGAGGAAGLVADLARCGVETITLVDDDVVSATNVGTQMVNSWDIGARKVDALRDRLRRINPAIDCLAIPKRYQDLNHDDKLIVWGANIILAMTDDFQTQALINRHAIAYQRDCIFAICYVGCDAVEVTASFPDTIAAGWGCHRCHTKRRYDAYREGFQNPSQIASHAMCASYLNAIIGHLVLSRLHQQAGSPLPISDMARAFAQAPCLISRLSPQFALTPDMQPGALLAPPFSTRLYELDSPKDWTCPDCGTPGVVPGAKEAAAPSTPNQERNSPCVDRYNPAASAESAAH